MKIGVIGRADPTGLGTMTIDFCRHIPVEKSLIMARSSRGFTRLSDVASEYMLLTDDVIGSLEWLVDGVDLVVGFETLYDPLVIPWCVEHGIKTAIFPMWECSPPEVVAADYVFSVCEPGMKRYPNAIRCHWPMQMETNRPWSKDGIPTHFVCNGGSLGLNQRNNVDAVAHAVAMGCFDGTGAFLHLRCHDYAHAKDLAAMHHKKIIPQQMAALRETLYVGCDVHVHLQAFEGLSLPLLESAACGIPQVVMDLPGFTSTHRVPVGHFETGTIGDVSLAYARPDLRQLASLLNDLATGRIEPVPPPKPPTWAEFKRFFMGVVCGPNG